MKKISFQIQQYVPDKGWLKITRKINSVEIQKEISQRIIECDTILGHYAPLYRMRFRDKSWFYFSANSNFNIVDGKLIVKEESIRV